MAIILKPRFLIRALHFNGMKHSHLYYCYTWVPTFFYHILFINLILISPILSLTMIFVQKPIIYIHDIYKCPEIGKMFSDETTLNNILYLTLCPLIRQSHDWLNQHFFFISKTKLIQLLWFFMEILKFYQFERWIAFHSQFFSSATTNRRKLDSLCTLNSQIEKKSGTFFFIVYFSFTYSNSSYSIRSMKNTESKN